MLHAPYSNTRLDCALCPYRFARCYIKKDAPKEGSEAANRGAAVHYAIEKILNAILAGNPPPPINEVMQEALSKHPVRLTETFQFVGNAIKRFADNPLRMIDPQYVVGVEEELAITQDYKPIIYTNPACFVRGKADVLMIKDTTATLIDHKTTLHVGDDDTESFQMALYALLVLCTYPYLTEVYTIIHYAAPDLDFYSKTPSYWSRADLETFKTFLEQRIATAEAIDGNTTVAYPGSYCQYCSVLNDCPMEAKLAKGVLKSPGPISDINKAMEYAEAHVFMEEKRKAVQTHLNDFVKNVCAVPVGDSVVEMRTYGGRSYDNLVGVLDCLKKYGINTAAFLKLDSGALSEFIESPNTKAELKAELEKLTYKKPTTRMGVYKQRKGVR